MRAGDGGRLREVWVRGVVAGSSGTCNEWLGVYSRVQKGREGARRVHGVVRRWQTFV